MLLRLEKELAEIRQKLSSAPKLSVTNDEDGPIHTRGLTAPSPKLSSTNDDDGLIDLALSDCKQKGQPSSVAASKRKSNGFKLCPPKKTKFGVTAGDDCNNDVSDFLTVEPQSEISSSNVHYMVTRHREVFMERAFGERKSRAYNELCKTQAELDHIQFVLENWEPHVHLKSISDLDHKDKIRKFRESNMNGYKWSRQYALETIKLSDGTMRTIIRRIEGNTVGRIVVSLG
jgi:hypothetical protein